MTEILKQKRLHIWTILISIIFLASFLIFFWNVTSVRQQTSYDNHAAMETARTLITSDPHTYEFHPWRLIGQVPYLMILCSIFGFSETNQMILYGGVLWIFIGLVASARLFWLWVGPSWIALGIFLTSALPVVFHLTPTGYQDLLHFALVPLALLILIDPRRPWSDRSGFWLFWTLITISSYIRPTYVGLGLIILLAIDWGKRSIIEIIQRQLLILASLFVVFGVEFLFLFLVRGREYGWLTFQSLNGGLALSHLGLGSQNFGSPRHYLWEASLEGFTPLIILTGLWGLFLAQRKKETWSILGLAWLLWLICHMVIVPSSQLRYLITAGPLLVGGTLYSLKNLTQPWRGLIILGLIGTSIMTLTKEVPYHFLPSQKKNLSQIILEHIEEWDPQKSRVFWHGQLFTTLTAKEPGIEKDIFYNIHSIGSASLNYEMKTRVKKWPEKAFSQEDFQGWNQGLISSEMMQRALDGDIFIISSASLIYRMENVPPIGQLSDIEQLNPTDFNAQTLPPVQLPLMLCRLRRAFITPSETGWKAGPISLEGDGPQTWSGWPKAGRIQKLQDRWELVWLDRLILLNRNGQLK